MSSEKINKITLKINDITVFEAKEIMETVRDIERRDSSRIIFCQIMGLDGKSVEETKRILAEIFPVKSSAR